MRSLLKANHLVLAGFVIAGLAATGHTAQAATVVWDFNLPATASFSPPYPSVARLTLADSPTIGNYVEFTLDPNQGNPGFGSNSTVSALNIVFSGSAALASSAYASISGPVADAASFGNNNNPLVAVVPPPASNANMDAGYTSGAGQLKLTWANPDFPVDQVSVWRISGTSIAANFSSLATANNKPSPTFGIISVSPINLTGLHPTPSNWVTGESPVPVPAAVWLFGSGLLGLAGISRKKTPRQS